MLRMNVFTLLEWSEVLSVGSIELPATVSNVASPNLQSPFVLLVLPGLLAFGTITILNTMLHT